MNEIRRTIIAAVSGALNGETTRIDRVLIAPNVAAHAARAYMQEWDISEDDVAIESGEDGVTITPARPPAPDVSQRGARAMLAGVGRRLFTTRVGTPNGGEEVRRHRRSLR